AYVLLSAGVLLLGRLGIRVGRVRQPRAAGVVGVFGAVVMLASTAYFVYRFCVEAGGIDEFPVLACCGFGAGGIGSCVMGYLGLRHVASMPFCTNCNVWKVNRLKHKFAVRPHLATQLLRSGEIVALADHDLSARPDGPLVLQVAGCPRCGEEAPI